MDQLEERGIFRLVSWLIGWAGWVGRFVSWSGGSVERVD